MGHVSQCNGTFCPIVKKWDILSHFGILNGTFCPIFSVCVSKKLHTPDVLIELTWCVRRVGGQFG